MKWSAASSADAGVRPVALSVELLEDALESAGLEPVEAFEAFEAVMGREK